MTTDPPQSDGEALKGTDTVGIRGFLRDLTYNEIHLAWLGLYAGFVAARPKPRHEPTDRMKQALKWRVNSWYWKTMYVVGYLLKAAALGIGFQTGTIQEYAPIVARILAGI